MVSLLRTGFTSNLKLDRALELIEFIWFTDKFYMTTSLMNQSKPCLFEFASNLPIGEWFHQS